MDRMSMESVRQIFGPIDHEWNDGIERFTDIRDVQMNENFFTFQLLVSNADDKEEIFNVVVIREVGDGGYLEIVEDSP